MASKINRVIVAFIITGILLSVINLFNFRSLWHDEACLALNIIDKNMTELLSPLEHDQVAPIGFLLTEKIFTFVLGESDWSLRVFPLFGFLLSIYLIYSLTAKILDDKTFGLFASAFFATSLLSLQYSTEVKQYMFDVTFTLAILLSTIIYNGSSSPKQSWLYASVGALAIWYSNISIILLFTSGLYSIYKTYYSEDQKYLPLAYILGLWSFVFGLYYLMFIHDHPTRGHMVSYWQDAFLPNDILSFDFWQSLKVKFFTYFGLLRNKIYAFILLPLFIFGTIFLFNKKRPYLFLLLFPLFIHLILAYLQLYPFHTRLILYLLPTLILIIICGFYSLGTLFKINKTLVFYTIPCCLVTNLSIVKIHGFPTENEELKTSMAYIDSEFSKGDKIYVYYGAYYAFNFYRHIFDSNEDIDDSKIVYTNSNRDDWHHYNELISEMNDSVWILFSHTYWELNEEGLNEEEYILNAYRNYGYQIIDEQKHTGSSVYYAVKTIPTPDI